MKESQYLMDYLEDIEGVISQHSIISRKRKYLIYRDGYFYTGTDSFRDVLKLVCNDSNLYTYKRNPPPLE